MRERQRVYLRRNWESMHNIADDYEPDVPYENHPLLNIGIINKTYAYCNVIQM